MRAIAIALALCLGMAWAGESSTEAALIDQLENQVKIISRTIDSCQKSIKELELKGDEANAAKYRTSLETYKRAVAEKQEAIAKLRQQLTPEQEIAKAEADVKAAEKALEAAKERLKMVKQKHGREF